jgi:hypothetical protein
MNGQRSGPPVVIGDVEIETIDQVVVRVETVCGLIVGVALKEPIAVVVRSPAGTWRVDLDSRDRVRVTDQDDEDADRF